MSEDKSEIAEMARKVYRFAKGRKSESNSQKFLMWMSAFLGAAATAAFVILNNILIAKDENVAPMPLLKDENVIPILLLSWMPLIYMTSWISTLAMVSKKYRSIMPPTFKADGRILREMQLYLEHLFSEYKGSLQATPAAISQGAQADPKNAEPDSQTDPWYQVYLTTGRIEQNKPHATMRAVN